jgi:MoxR-like ATPase
MWAGALARVPDRRWCWPPRRALMHQRLAVTREDIAEMLLPVLAHRVLRNFEAEADGIAIAEILQALREHIRPD